MIYSTIEFISLFFCTFLLFTLIPNKTFKLITLICTSLIFYSWAGILEIGIFACILLVAWTCTVVANRKPKHKKSILAFGIMVMASNLLFWKYFPWIVANIQMFAPTFNDGKPVHLPLPVGISFFTLQGIAYLVDFSRGQVGYINFPQFLLFKSFFSQLVAGPICRVPELVPQIKEMRGAKKDDISIGITIFMIGFFKKLMIADRVSPIIDPVFANPGNYDRMTLFAALLGYTVQIWADFSGYTDMGVGTARMLGIKLPDNFLSPYLAKSPSEFWRRWHITLSQWIRDYIYIPLGGNKGSKGRVLFTATLTMFISGLWHGAAWTFVIWGLYHGVLLIIERLLKGSPISIAYHRIVPNFVQGWGLMLLMFSGTVFGWLIFRSQSLALLGQYISGFVTNSVGSHQVSSPSIILQSILLCFLIQGLKYFDFKEKQYFCFKIWDKFALGNSRIHISGRQLIASKTFALTSGIAMAIFAIAIALLQVNRQAQAFIYFQF